jgi:S1-C subfamily serine protease
MYPSAEATTTPGSGTPLYLGVVTDEKFDPQRAAALGVPATTQGLIINQIVDYSPAFNAGLRKNDIITHIDDTAIDSIHMLRWKVSTYAPQAQVNVGIIRSGMALVVPAILTPRL